MDPPDPGEQVLEPEPETASESDQQLTTLDFNDLKISIRVGERAPTPDEDEDEDEDEGPSGFIRVEVARGAVESVDAFEHDADFDGCFVGQIEVAIDGIFSDGELLVFEANYRCVMGETVTHVTTEHLVMAAWEHEPGLGLLYEGTSKYINNRGLAVSLDKREFYVEAYDLAIYRHSVAWCDEDGMREARGVNSGCAESRRKLKLLKRVPIGVPTAP